MIESSVQQELGDEQGWRTLEASLRPFIASRIEIATAVDDVLQDVFLKIQRGLATLRDSQRFGAWVYQVTRNAIADHQRTTARHPVTNKARSEKTDDELTQLEERNTERELAGACAAAFVRMLPSPYREALTLVEVEGLAQTAAADKLGISVTAMKSRVQRGRKKLRAALEDCCNVALDARRRVVGFEPRTDGKPERCR